MSRFVSQMNSQYSHCHYTKVELVVYADPQSQNYGAGRSQTETENDSATTW